MATNKFLPFNTNKLNMQSDATYAAETQRLNGVVNGIAKADMHNKIFRQASVMAAAIGEHIVDAGYDASDDSVSGLKTAIGNAIALKPYVDAQLAQKALQADLDTTNASVALKAEQSSLDTTNYNVTQKASTAYVDAQIQNMSSQVQEFYATVSALTTAFPTGNSNNYVVTADNYIYRWSGSAWTSTGVLWNASGLSDNSVTFAKASKTDIQTTRYPFQNAAQLKSADGTIDLSTLLKAGILDLVLYGAVSTELYSFGRITVKSTETNITIWNSAYTVVCQYYYAGRRSGIETINLSTANSSGITGKLKVNWGAFDSGTNYDYQALTYSKVGIDLRCYDPTLRIYYMEQDITSKQTQIDDIKSYSKFPFSKRALMYRSQYNDGTIDRKAFKSLCFTTKKAGARYYVRDFINNTTKRTIRIYSEDVNSNNDVEELLYTASNGGTRNTSVEYITLTNSGDIRGYAIIDWNYATAYNLYSLNDTEIDFACYLPTNVLFNPLLADSPKLITWDNYYAVVGHEFNLYTEDIVQCKDINNLRVSYKLGDGYIGNQYDDRLRFMPVVGDIGIKTLNIKVYYDNTIGATPVIDKNVTITVLAATSVTTEKKAIFIGDSFTAAGVFIKELKDNLIGSNLTLLGTRGTAPYLHEGRSGWTSSDYMANTTKNGATNAFWNPSTSSFDFSYYMTQQGYASVDYVTILLGTNDGYDANATVPALTIMVNSIHAFNPNIKIFIMTVCPTPKSNYSWGRLNFTSDRAWNRQRYCYDFATQIQTTFGNRTAEHIHIVPLFKTIDKVYDFDYATQAVSARNPVTASVCWENVHVNQYGYLKIADEWYYVQQSTM